MHKDHILFHLDPNSNSLSIQNNAPYSNIYTVLPIEHILHSRPTMVIAANTAAAITPFTILSFFISIFIYLIKREDIPLSNHLISLH